MKQTAELNDWLDFTITPLHTGQCSRTLYGDQRIYQTAQGEEC